jgi:plastocyanin
MHRRTIAVLATVALASVGAASPALAARGAATPLAGTVGPGFTITLAKAGKKVTTLKAGTYTITVSDKASVHNFHLIGKGLDKEITTVPFVGTKKLTVTLAKGTYTYQCDPHASSGMKGTFKVS